MNTGRYIFSQITDFLPKRKFERIMSSRIKNKIADPTLGWQLSYWNQLLVLMFGQLDGCRSLRELTDIVMAHKEKSFHLGFGKYGVVGENMTASRKVILKNTGNEVFRIKGTTTSCDCMTAEYDWDEIPPGGKAAMTVKYKAEEPGDFWQTITIYGNIPEKSFTLDFWGTVRK